MNPHVARLAERVKNDPAFLAAALVEYARSEGLDDPALARHLGCAGSRLPLLKLCRMPRTEAPHFWNDIERIADHFQVNADTLADAVRLGQSLLHVRGSHTGSDPAGWLLAARDRPRKEDES